jgi:hypothetical protein
LARVSVNQETAYARAMMAMREAAAVSSAAERIDFAGLAIFMFLE